MLLCLQTTTCDHQRWIILDWTSCLPLCANSSRPIQKGRLVDPCSRRSHHICACFEAWGTSGTSTRRLQIQASQFLPEAPVLRLHLIEPQEAADTLRATSQATRCRRCGCQVLFAVKEPRRTGLILGGPSRARPSRGRPSRRAERWAREADLRAPSIPMAGLWVLECPSWARTIAEAAAMPGSQLTPF